MSFDAAGEYQGHTTEDDQYRRGYRARLTIEFPQTWDSREEARAYAEAWQRYLALDRRTQGARFITTTKREDERP